MKLLKSKRGIPIPKLYLVTNRKDIGSIPKGVPYIYADESLEDTLVRMLEYEVLFQRAKATGLPFNFRKILKSNGFKDIRDLEHDGRRGAWNNARMNVKTSPGGVKDLKKVDHEVKVRGNHEAFSQFVKDSSVYVDISVLKGLKIFPTWMAKVEKAISTNIATFATWDTNMYNKKLDGMYGGVRMTPPHKNLIVIDISSSIPRAVSSTCLALAKNMAESFYADLLITGSKSTLYDYNEVRNLDVQKLYDDNGMNNDQIYFRALVEEIQRDYDTAIVFGDDHVPGYAWNSHPSQSAQTISTEDGKKLCKWNIHQVISFHTYNERGGTRDHYYEERENAEDGYRVAGYADWFSPEKITHIDDWVRDMQSR